MRSRIETIAAGADPDKRATLERESSVLAAFLPKSLGVDEIVAALSGSADAIRAAGSDGQATGVAMKALKASGATVNGKDVATAVKKIRS